MNPQTPVTQAKEKRELSPSLGQKALETTNLTSPAHTPLSFLGEESGDLNNFAEMQNRDKPKAPSHCGETQCLPKLELAPEKQRGSDDP